MEPPSPLSTWELVIDGFDPITERVVESLLAVSNGLVGSQSSLPEGSSVSNPATFVAGLFNSAEAATAVPELVVAPDWLAVQILIEGQPLLIEQGEWLAHCRRLDFRRGTIVREWRQRDPSGRITRVVMQHCASLADRHVLLQEIDVTPENYSGRVTLELRVSGPGEARAGAPRLKWLVAGEGRSLIARSRPRQTVEFTMSGTGGLEDAQGSALQCASAIGQRWQWDAYLGSTYRFTKMVTVRTSPEDSTLTTESALVSTPNFPVLQERHEESWAERWDAADIEIAGNDAHQRALRFAIYHLAGAVNPDDEHVSIAARGLTGESYKGHVFWDTDIFLTPFYIATEPQAARSLLMYRYHTLSAARAKAARFGYEGALYAWESAADGQEVTPEKVRGLSGEIIPIWTGLRAHHISADIAYAVWQYWQATHDAEFLLEFGAEILFETARFWASRAIRENDGRYHIRGVIGPDEYHECADDNAYTNGMARWNLRVAIDAAELLADQSPERWSVLRQALNLDARLLDRWLGIADNLVDGLDSTTELMEQFHGYHDLEEVDLAAFEPREAPMDVLLGREKTERSKVIKQADVLMLQFLLRETFTIGVIERNFRYYEPRTGHGSSLSPGIHAALAARLGDVELAERYFEQTASIDLDDRMGNAAGGIHMAAQGSLWQAAVFGFAGVEWRDDAMVVDPRLPASWKRMQLPMQWRGRRLHIRLDSGAGDIEIDLEVGEPLIAFSSSGESSRLQAGKTLRVPIDGPWVLREEPSR
ncbi:MAG TPA: glycosyl hydrolase family 65 protein [Chloroflexota bacterium]|nr:glycosyl hydrolase family 65 protein [Chloroflexota bacterium]